LIHTYLIKINSSVITEENTSIEATFSLFLNMQNVKNIAKHKHGIYNAEVVDR
jgi:hypothetical protein